MGIRRKKKDEETAPEPEPVKVPSRGVLLNKWANRQEKLQKLVSQVADTKSELAEIARLLHEVYGVMVQDTTHTVTLPKTTPPEKQVSAEGAAEGAPTGQTTTDEGETLELIDPGKNPLAKSPIPITVEPSVTQPMTEQQVEKIRKDSQLEKGATPGEMAKDVATNLERAVRLGLGKT